MRNRGGPSEPAILQGLAPGLFGGDPPARGAKALVAAAVDGETPHDHLRAGAGADARRTAASLRVAGREARDRPRPGRRRARRPAASLPRRLRRQRLERADAGPARHGQAGRPARPDRPRRRTTTRPNGRCGWAARCLGQWVIDVRRLLDAMAERDGRLPGEILVAGVGPAGLVAICSAALDSRITRVAASGMLASYVTEEPYEGQRLGMMVPGILRDAGDVAHLAALVAPRRLVIAGGVTGGGQPLDAAALDAAFAFTRRVYEVEGAAGELRVLPDSDPGGIVEGLK